MHVSAICWSVAVSYAVAQCWKIYNVHYDDAAFYTALAPVVVVHFYYYEEVGFLLRKAPEKKKERSDTRESDSGPA